MISRYVDTAVVVVVFKLWVLLAVFLLGRLGRLLAVGNRRSHEIAARHAVLAVVAFVGVVFVVVSETAHMVVVVRGIVNGRGRCRGGASGPLGVVFLTQSRDPTGGPLRRAGMTHCVKRCFTVIAQMFKDVCLPGWTSC